MLKFRVLLANTLFLLLAAYAWADLQAMESEFNKQLAANDVEAAHVIGIEFYNAANAQKNDETAGRVAYAMASIEALLEQKTEVPIWFERCARHYKAIEAVAQQVDCTHKAALSYKSINQPGTSRDRLKSAERALKAAQATDTIVAALVYTDLAESYIPPQFEIGASADADRRRVLDYTQQAREILSAHDQEDHLLYATLLAREATALEDLERYEEAEVSMVLAMALIAKQPEQEELLADLRRRYAKISAWNSNAGEDRNQVTVKMENGREVILKVKRRKRVIYPKTKGVSSEYGLGRVLITLSPDGKVDRAEIVESEPTPAFGEAVKKAVEDWIFTPLDDTPPESIPAFQYGVSFDYVRRR